jgi:hypothetical protein
MTDNWYEWQGYVNSKIDEFEHYIKTREKDLEMANLRLQRLLDATLHQLGEVESQLPSASRKDTPDTIKGPDGPTPSL